MSENAAPAPAATTEAPAPAVPASFEEVLAAHTAAASQAEAPANEKPASAPLPPAATETKDDASRYAALARKEGELFRQQAQIKAREKDFAAAEQAVKDLAALRDLAQQNPVALLEKYGVKLDAVKARIAELDSTDPTARLQREVDEMKKSQAAADQAARLAAENRQVQENVARHKSEIAAFAKANLEKFELVSTYGDMAIDLAQQTVIRHLQQTEKLLSHEEALTLVEKYLDDRYVAPALASKKVQGRFKPPEATKPPVPASGAQTLSNSMTAAPVSEEVEGIRPGESNDAYFERLLRTKGIS